MSYYVLMLQEFGAMHSIHSSVGEALKYIKTLEYDDQYGWNNGSCMGYTGKCFGIYEHQFGELYYENDVLIMTITRSDDGTLDIIDENIPTSILK